ncbi:conserved hypothetical protein [Rhodopseudomonas palustris HaA2]|uniref:PNPLA domain-containing protein n=1 Tax=Rhodopseudomonas palustris (strain HaA2) TaxID=316058 RepID=Q2ITD1_RHOP2|nr:conserved hypothetical protein [Rhodopseudomonas palustris HaA2]
MLLDEATMLAEEEAFLWPTTKPDYRAGLSLSGGGIRAATVALGVLEGLASRGLLQRIHYLSTVSGGGYIGSALSWFWCERRVVAEAALQKSRERTVHRFGADTASFPFQEERANASPVAEAAALNLKFLRQHGSYLTSGDGIGFAGLIMAVLRTVLLSLAVWMPLLIAIFLSFEVLDSFLSGASSDGELAAKCETAVGTTVFACRPSFIALLSLAGAVGVAIFIGTILFAFLGHLASIRASGKRGRWIALSASVGIGLAAHVIWKYNSSATLQPLLGAQLLLELFMIAAAISVAISQMSLPENWSYSLRRRFEKASSKGLPIAITAVSIGLLPLIVATLKLTDPSKLGAFEPVWGTVTLLSGVGTALYGYYLKAKSLLPGVAGKFFAIAGSLLFLSGLLILSFATARQLFLLNTNWALTGGAGLFMLSIAIGVAGSLNATGLHRFYRDRLMETFMPMTDAISQGTARQSDVADTLTVVDVVRSAEERGDRPYHLLNAHAILVNEPDDPKLALRGGDNFLISPAIIGSSATGWMRSRDYLRLQGPLTLASAMAASGAATNANAGYIGTGVTRDRFLSAVMSILNIRLGLWVGNPRWLAAKSLFGLQVLKAPTYFQPGLTAGILGFGHHRKAKFLELSDGGHFENLGLYELVRRRLDLIIVVDAEQDKDINLSALVSSHNRIKEDFGVALKFAPSDKGKGPELFLGEEAKNRYPRGLPLAKSPFMVARIEYPATKSGEPNKTGVLIYLKSTIVEGLDFATLGYRALNADFPHQTTADQFFDPDQFQAYRNLGLRSCEIMATALDLEANFDKPTELLKKYDDWKPGASADS